MTTKADHSRDSFRTAEQLVQLAEHIRIGYTAEHRPVRVMVSIIPGDPLILQYTIPT